jgi:hypothetical protein
MDIASIAAGVVGSATASGSLNVDLLSSVNNLSAIEGALLARSIGLGNGIDQYA